MTRRPRVAYVLPKVDDEDHEHIYYLRPFLSGASRHVDLDVLVERSSGPVDLPGVDRTTRIRWRFPPLRLLSTLVWAVQARFRGASVFYSHYSTYGAIACGLVARVLGGRSLYWHCGPVWALWNRPEERAKRWARFRNRFVLSLSLAFSHALVTCTDRMARGYRKHFHVRRTRVMPNWTSLERFGQGPSREDARRALGLPPGIPILLFFHRVTRYRAELLPEIAARVVAGRPDARFVVCGGGDWLGELRAKIDRLGLGGAFDVRGWIPQRDAPIWFRAADLFLMTSQIEGFGRVLLEAMASSTPLVAARASGGVLDVLSDFQAERATAGPRDPAEFARVCLAILDDPALRERLVEVGLERVSRFGERTTLDTWLGIVAEEGARRRPRLG